MREYESVIILTPELNDNEINAIIDKIDKIISKKGKITEKQKLGLKKLAYNIKGRQEGYYVSHQFEIDDKVYNKNCIPDIEKFFRTQEEIIKFIVVERS
mgnify:FL=1